MNICNDAFDGTPNYPVKLEDLGDDGFRVTSPNVKGKEWTGDTQEHAMKAFREDMNKEYDRLMFESRPKWMTTMAKKA